MASGLRARAGGRREIRCPADGSLVAEVDEAGVEDTEAAIAAAHRAFHDGPWPHTSARERGDLLAKVADLLERDKADLARMESLDTGKRLVESEYDIDDIVSVFRHYGRVAAEDAGRDGRHRQRRRRQPDRARAGRRLRPGHSVELPAPPGLLEGRALPGRRQHVRAQAQRAHPAHGHPPDEAARGGRTARGRRQPGARRRRCRRPAALRGPARRPGVVHRRARHRQGADGRGRRHRQEGRPRARRQEPQHRLRRRRPRGRARLRAHRGLPALGPGLLGRRAAGGRGVDPRPVRRRPGRAGRADPAGRPVRREGRDRPADQRRPPRQGRGVRRRRTRRGRRTPVRRQAPRRPGPGRRLLLPAHRARPAAPARCR